jgi:anthranilate synthase component 1
VKRVKQFHLSISQSEFKKLSNQFNRIPICCSFHSDLDTPLSIYLKLEQQSTNAFLLESVEKNEKIARYSIIGFDPIRIFKSKGNQFWIIEPNQTYQIKTNDPLGEIEKRMQLIHQMPIEKPMGFLGGLVGYVGYDLVRTFEKIPSKISDVLELPELYLMETNQMVIFDHFRQTFDVIVNAVIENSHQYLKVYKKVSKQVQDIIQKIFNTKFDFNLLEIPSVHSEILFPFGFHSNQSPNEFKKNIRKAKTYIRDGDLIQIVLSQRFEKKTKANAITIYRVLRHLNPSPYMFLLKMNGIELVGASPEMLVKVQEGIITMHPIAGSRPRGKTDHEDIGLEKELLHDEKELSEHVMLVDLARNDLGRVCEPGTVVVPQFKKVEKYSHVMHIVSEVTGRLKKDQTPWRAFRSAFPAGTLSGAPKIKAMELIEELEPSQRGIYGGTVVAYGYNQALDSAIAIRSVVLKKNKLQKMAFVQAGCGIVADSIPHLEYQESCNKAKAVMLAVGLSEQWSD